MARSNPQIVSFNAGEWSPLMYGRWDLGKHSNAQRRSENMIPTVQGPSKRRGGTRYVSSQLDHTQRTWFVDFIYSAAQAYVLEFGPGYIGFYASRAVLVANPGAPMYRITSPYTAADLTRADGTFALDVEQAGDVIYIACPTKWPRKLYRVGPVEWYIEEHVTQDGPLQEVNARSSAKIVISARTGNIDANASEPVFSAGMVGMLLRIDLEDKSSIPPWEPGKAFAANSYVRSDGKTYLAKTADGTRLSGTAMPIHEAGEQADGSGKNEDNVPIGIRWEYQDAGYGIGKIISYISPTKVALEIHNNRLFPQALVGANPVGGSSVWQLGAWGEAGSYPSCVVRWKGRLVYLGRRSLWMSSPGGFDDFPRDIQGEARADAGITLELDSADTITWAHAAEALIVGTGSGEFIVRKQTETEALSAANIDAVPKSSYGSRAIAPAKLGAAIAMVNKSGRRVRSVTYDTDTLRYEAPDITVAAEHITRSGIIGWAFQQQPDRVLWAWRADGALIGATLEDGQEVLAWHRHPTNGAVESACVIPSPDGSRDDLWLKVRRTVGGQVRRFTEFMEEGHVLSSGAAAADAFFVDCGLTYRGEPVTVVGGLEHLIGEDVSVLADAGAMPNQVVEADGSISLQQPASVVHVGLPMKAVLQPIAIPRGGQLGSAQAQTGTIGSVKVLIIESAGGKVGPSEAKLRPIMGRSSHVPGGKAPDLVTGYIGVDIDGSPNDDPQIVFVQDQPLPMTIGGFFPETETNERS